MSMRNRTKAATGVVAAALLVVAGAQLAQAVTSPSTPTYTGCLATSGSAEGKFAAVKLGSSPARSCTSSEQLVRLSSGDITSVAGGQAVRVTSTSLGAPDTNGDVSLDLAPQYKLPQGCADGQVPKKAGSTWSCQAQFGATFLGYTGHDYRQIGDAWSVVGDGMDLPAGSYALTAKVMVHGPSNADIVRSQCRLDATGSQSIDISDMFVEDGNAANSVVLVGAVTKPDGFRVSVVCRDYGDDAMFSDLRIRATPISGFTNTYLGD